MNVKLYEIPQEWQKILTELEENYGELTPEIEAASLALIQASKDKLESAGLAMRNLEIHAALAVSQAAVFQQEAATCTETAKRFAAAADRLGALMAPALEITGKVKTAAGTLFTSKRTNWAFEMKPGTQFYELPEELWRQRDPELNKTELKKRAEAGTLPEQILAVKTDSLTVCLKPPSAKKDATAETPAETVASAA